MDCVLQAPLGQGPCLWWLPWANILEWLLYTGLSSKSFHWIVWILTPITPILSVAHGRKVTFPSSYSQTVLTPILEPRPSLAWSTCVLSRSVMSNSFWPHGLQPRGLLCPWDSPGKNTGVGCHALLQGIFPTQGSNPSLLHWRVDSLLLGLPGKPLE